QQPLDVLVRPIYQARIVIGYSHVCWILPMFANPRSDLRGDIVSAIVRPRYACDVDRQPGRNVVGVKVTVVIGDMARVVHKPIGAVRIRTAVLELIGSAAAVKAIPNVISV